MITTRFMDDKNLFADKELKETWKTRIAISPAAGSVGPACGGPSKAEC